MWSRNNGDSPNFPIYCFIFLSYYIAVELERDSEYPAFVWFWLKMTLQFCCLIVFAVSFYQYCVLYLVIFYLGNFLILMNFQAYRKVTKIHTFVLTFSISFPFQHVYFSHWFKCWQYFLFHWAHLCMSSKNKDFLFKFLLWLFIYVYGGNAYMPWCICEGQFTTFVGQFSSSTMGTKLRISCLLASTFTYRSILIKSHSYHHSAIAKMRMFNICTVPLSDLIFWL